VPRSATRTPPAIIPVARPANAAQVSRSAMAKLLPPRTRAAITSAAISASAITA